MTSSLWGRANPEHLSILKQGVAVWNEWRRAHPELRPDFRLASLHDAPLSGSDPQPQLSHVDLHDAVLYGADLSQADLTRANLKGADLRGASMRRAVLYEANLNESMSSDADATGAQLSGATLLEANLRGATLNGADLRAADLSGATLHGAHLDGADLSGATLRRTFLRKATLRNANLRGAFMSDVDLGQVDLSGASLADAHLRGAFFSEANLKGADLSGANLIYARLVDVDLSGANLANCSVYGVSAWNVATEDADQSNLVITRPDEATITVDHLEIAQFIHLLLNNGKVRDVIESVTSKAVLILGRFKAERKVVLDALRDEVRRSGYLPILFDFDKPSSRNLTETVATLAHLARFVIADITDARSIPQELQRIVPMMPSLPVQPLLLASDEEYGMFDDFRAYPWVLEPYRYENIPDLLASLQVRVIAPAIARVARSTAGTTG